MKSARSVRRFFDAKNALLAVTLSVAMTAAAATTFSTLANFAGGNGANPYADGLVQGVDGNFYGTTQRGGAHTSGTVFKVTPSGAITTLYSFCSLANCADGAFPIAGLILATDGNFYGTTFGSGGTSGFGTAFKITPTGTLTTLYTFCSQKNCKDGSEPAAPLVQATDGNFYGATELGGVMNRGAVFKITPAGVHTTLYSFCAQANCADGTKPVGGLIQASDGNLYGTTEFGGTGSQGTVFQITTTGTLTTLHNFSLGDGGDPQGALVQASDGTFYGTTGQGGTHNAGTVFNITSAGSLTTLYNFCSQTNCADGSGPVAGLILGTDGNFYGATYQGGLNSNFGTAFQITAGGTLTSLHTFTGSDGARPFGSLTQATNGTFYGTTYDHGSHSDGTVFSVSTGLGPFIESVPASGKVGTAVVILGNNLTGTTSVTFNGTAAKFKVISSTEIKTAVPTGATTGSIVVTTPTGTLTSNVPFTVM